MRAVGKTDIGNVRENNEDVLYVSLEPVGSLPNLFLVADGMGGHKAGEVASQNALKFFLDYVSNIPCNDGELLDYLTGAVAHTNNAVYELSLTDAAYSGMGTTFSVCIVSEDKAYIAHIGDSRIYRLNDGRLSQLTNDHTFVSEMMRAGQFSKEEAEQHPGRNALTRALGVDRDVLTDAPTSPVMDGDLLLMCSDGLSNMVHEDEIANILRSNNDVLARASALIDRAKSRGGSDNVTVIVIEV